MCDFCAWIYKKIGLRNGSGSVLASSRAAFINSWKPYIQRNEGVREIGKENSGTRTRTLNDSILRNQTTDKRIKTLHAFYVFSYLSGRQGIEAFGGWERRKVTDNYPFLRLWFLKYIFFHWLIKIPFIFLFNFQKHKEIMT